MIQNQQYRYVPTDLQLNGPILSFTTTPSDTTLGAGQSAYFTGIATAQFPNQTPANPAVGFATGTIAYQWYEVSEGALSDGTKYVGTATTELIISDIVSPDDSGKQYYLSADYVAIGTSPNANNESFTSSRATLNIYPEIIINTHPSNVSVATSNEAVFSIDASLTDGTYGNLSYQWRIDGENITDGTYETSSISEQGVKGQIDDAVLLLPLNEDVDNPGSVNFNDYSDNTKTITPGSSYGAAPVWQNTGLATGNFYNGAAYFNGSTSYINVSGSADFRMTDQPFTMEAWIKWSDNSWSGTWEVISCLGGGYYSDGGIWWAILRDSAKGSSGESTTFYISHAGGYSAIATGIDIRADDDEWHHFAVTRTSRDDGHLVRMWMDGVKIGENSVNFVDKNFGGGALGYIGLEHATFHTIGYYYPNCWMQDFKCYKGLDKYKENFTPSTTSILGYTRNVSIFDTSFPSSLALPLWNRSGTLNEVDLTDISPNKLAVTAGTTNLIWDEDVKKWYDGSAKFPNESTAALSVASSDTLAFGTEDFTIEAWCYFTKTSFSDIFSTDSYTTTYDTASGGLFAFRKDSNEKLSWYQNQEYDSTNEGITGGDVIPQNTWVHCAISRQSGVVRMFLNGKFQDSADVRNDAGDIPSITAGIPRIGGVEGNNNPMGGYIQDLVVYKGVAKYTEDFVVPNRSILSEDKTYSQISGSQTNKLTITPDEASSSKVTCVVSNPNTTSKTSNEATLIVNDPRTLIKIEGYDTTSTATLLERNLDDSEFSLSASDVNSDDICLYSAEKDIEVEFDLYAGKGSDKGSFVGGEGGYSRISFTMKNKEEYILRGLKSNTGLFLYRKGSLIAAVGSGGDAGTTGNGGKGGGVDIAGQSGSGGAGAPRIGIGNLLENGTLGSASGLPVSELYPEDGKSIGTFGGITIKCSKGKYWRDQGKSPCEDLGRIKFRLSDGTEVTNSATINRGFKAGYSINRTAGAYDSGAGWGGDGAAGGDGGTGGGGGGGGSGYSDGSVNIVSSTLGGSTGNARINVRIYTPDSGFYVDDKGRILIMSCTDTRDPNTLEITTGKILIGDNKVLDDTRWQRFLDLARDGTKDYRITATLNNSSVKITNATTKNIHRMLNANQLTLRNSMARGWVDMSYVSAYAGRKALAWDETSGATITGVDYSMMWWVSGGNGWGFYGWSSNPFFAPTIYYQKSVNYWILPPGVPDF